MSPGSALLELFTASNGSLISSDSAITADKYAVAVIRAKEIIQTNTSFKSAKSPELRAKIATQFDRLLGFLMTQFKATATEGEVSHVLRNTPSINALNEIELAELSDGIVPVAIIRELFSKHRVFVNPNQLSNWTVFVEKYRFQVLHA